MINFLPNFSVTEVVTDPAVAFEASMPAKERSAGVSPAKPRLTFQRNEDRMEKHKRLVASGQLKHARGQRPTFQELLEMKVDDAIAEQDKIFDLMKEKSAAPHRSNYIRIKQGDFDGIRAALAQVVTLILFTEAHQIEQRWKLEDRIAELEAARRE